MKLTANLWDPRLRERATAVQGEVTQRDGAEMLEQTHTATTSKVLPKYQHFLVQLLALGSCAPPDT